MNMIDAENAYFAEALASVAERFPDTIAIHLEASTTDSAGYDITDIDTPAGPLSKIDPDALEEIQDETDGPLSNLTWRGLIRDCKRGYATIDLNGNKIA